MTNNNIRLPKTVGVAAVVLLVACAGPVLAQNTGPSGGNREGEAAPPPVSQSQEQSQDRAQGQPRESGATGPGSMTVGKVPGHTGQVSTVQEKPPDPAVEQTEKQVSRRMKSICNRC